MRPALEIEMTPHFGEVDEDRRHNALSVCISYSPKKKKERLRLDGDFYAAPPLTPRIFFNRVNPTTRFSIMCGSSSLQAQIVIVLSPRVYCATMRLT